MASRQIAALALLMAGAAACAPDGRNPTGSGGAALHLTLSGLAPLDPAREGVYEAWTVDAAGSRRSAGTFALPAGGKVVLATPVTGAVAVEVTVEPPGDADPAPSAQRLLRGTLRKGRAELSLVGAVTQGDLSLREQPGQFTMYFSPSDNHLHGFPSHEESGIWLFNIYRSQTQQNDGWVRLTQLQPGWTYEGWVVRDLGTPGAVWLSYGKFVPDVTGAINARDDTGWGPFSGVLDFKTAGEEEYPGDDWISNPLGFPLPGGLRLPLDLTEKNAAGEHRWSHVITIEPVRDRGEPLTTERPFPLRPYRDRFGGPSYGEVRPYGLPHPITFHPQTLPRGVAEVAP